MKSFPQVTIISSNCNAVENHVVLSEAKSIYIDLSIPLRSSRDEDSIEVFFGS
ncbi:hypothetical protein HDC90_002543 [Pedobacter sp. AK013]|nr:hypothetical protein [Pedobacter sp. AK013]